MGEVYRQKGKENNMSKKIDKRIQKNKELVIEKLKTTPVVQIACKKAGISRATFYRWKKDDEIFSKEADTALEEGSALINDMAESQLLNAIRDQNMTAIIFWLKHHHKTYTTRVEISSTNREIDALKPDQEKLVRKALELASLIPGEEKEEKNENS